MTRGRAMRRAAGAGGALPERPLGGAPRQASLPPRARTRSQSKQQAGEPVDSDPEVFFLRVRLEDTGEVFRVSNCCGDTTVRELREDLDLIVGIPFNLQRLHYLDQGDMIDDGTLKLHDVVPGGVISLSIWHYDGWIELVLAAVEGDLSKLSCLGITEDSFYRTANSRHLEGEKWKRWTSQRAFVALYIASHRGHYDMVRYLLEQGRQKFKTPGQGAAKGFRACYFQPEHCWGHGHTVCTILVPPAVGTSQGACIASELKGFA
uniref:ankyrin repeat domain-containing protein 60 isoform X3 n=1 Tax=Ictidomys tridecemlineatus TaxID=43179 RepID=UPI001A9D976A|nr:ankyrin repeat domain-containing protein 60 isoform X3 [Ictidomys tridecemlineatus]